MILKGKAKEDFEKWYKDRAIEIITNEGWGFIVECNNMFNQLPFSMQYGVYVDFFDSVGICVDDIKSKGIGYYCYIRGINKDGDYSLIASVFECKTRTEARQKAIEKAVEIYNNKFVEPE